MIKKETSSSILFRHWLRANPQYTCSHEMKDTRGKNYLAFSEVKQDQIDYAEAIESDHGVWIRVVAIQGGEPDYIYMRNQPAYVVIKYPKAFYVIRVKDFVKERDSSSRRSLTEERAKEIATTVVSL